MLFLAVAAAIILGLIPAVIASQKGYSIRLWWAFGAVLFPVTLPMALLLPTTAKALRRRELDRQREHDFRECPACHDEIRAEAVACPYCHCNVVPTRIAAAAEPALPRRFLTFPKPPLALLGVLAALLAGVLVARAFLIRSDSDRRVNAMLTGAAQARAADERAADDPVLRDNETDLGRIWSRDHRAADPSECPRQSIAFRLGCAQVARAIRK
jgi:hypothetical protein